MKWKLRIPLIVFVFGITAAFYEYLDIQSTYLLRSLLYLGSIAVIIWILEKTLMNEKKVHFSIGIMLVLTGFFADYFIS